MGLDVSTGVGAVVAGFLVDFGGFGVGNWWVEFGVVSWGGEFGVGNSFGGGRISLLATHWRLFSWTPPGNPSVTASGGKRCRTIGPVAPLA